MALDLLGAQRQQGAIGRAGQPEDDEVKAKAAETLQRIGDMSTADDRDPPQCRIGSCRYYHGNGHADQ